MPFTASHAAAVLPLVRRGRWVSAGLVTGSMAPDLPSFVPLGLGHEQTHPLSAILWPDGLLAVGLLVIWWVLLRPGLAPLWPAAAARCGPSGWRSAPTGRGPRRLLSWVGWLAASELVGLATHLGWDAFTHPDGAVVSRSATLSGRWAGHELFDWLQALSSVVGLAIVVLYLARSWRKRPLLEAAAEPISRTLRAGVIGLTAIAVAVAGGLEWRSLAVAHSGPLLTSAATTKAACSAGLAALAAWSLVWAVRSSARGRARPPHSSEPVGVP
jgi:Domain of unknown function (DUF4184)